jgi:hypothetical protein
MAFVAARDRRRRRHHHLEHCVPMGGKIVRIIGIVWARFKIGMMNLGYNIRRLVQLARWRPRPLECSSLGVSVVHAVELHDIQPHDPIGNVANDLLFSRRTMPHDVISVEAVVLA